MSKYFSRRISIFNLVCAVLALILLVLHFVPFWSYTTTAKDPATNETISVAATASIQGYVWLPENFKDLTTFFTETLGKGYNISSLLPAALLTLFVGVGCVVLYVIEPEKPWASLAAILCGEAGLWGYFSGSAIMLGHGWKLHLVLYTILLIVALASCSFEIKQFKLFASVGAVALALIGLFNFLTKSVLAPIDNNHLSLVVYNILLVVGVIICCNEIPKLKAE